MAQRGRKSAASLAVVPIGSRPRPEPPAELSKPAAEEWRRLVASMPADWFNLAAQPLLVRLCHHIVQARRLAALIDSFEDGWLTDVDGLARLDKLLAMADRESKAITSIATRLRLTPQSRYMPNAAARMTAKLPWRRGEPLWAGADDDPATWRAIP